MSLTVTDFSNINVLVVDDMDTALTYISNQLKYIGVANITTAKSIADAFKKINDKINMIICDHYLGEGRTGQDFITELRKEQKIPDSVICVMVSAERSALSVIGSAENYIDGYFVKPWVPGDFRDKIQAMLEKQELLTPVYDAIAKKNYKKALQICDSNLGDSKNFGHLKFRLKKLRADILVCMGLFISAIADYDTILGEMDAPWALHGKAKSLIHLSKYEEAEAILLDIIEKSPHYMACYDNLVSLYEAKGDLDKQEEILSKAIGKSGEQYHRHKKLAEVAIKNENPEVAQNMLGILHTKGRHSPYVDGSSIYIYTKMLRDGGREKEAVELLSSLKTSFRYDSDRVMSIRAIDDISRGKETSLPLHLLPPEACIAYAIQCHGRGNDALAQELCLSIPAENMGLIGVLFPEIPATLTTVLEKNTGKQKFDKLDKMKGSIKNSLKKGEWDTARRDIIGQLDEVKKQPDLLVMTIVFFCRYIEKSEEDSSSDTELVLVLWGLLSSISHDEKQLAICRLVMKQVEIEL